MSFVEDFSGVGDVPEAEADEFVAAATFAFPDEAEVTRGLLRSCDILC